MSADVVVFAAGLDARLRELLPGRVVGTYLHGSAALGGYVAGMSDVDLLFVIVEDTGSLSAADLGAELAAAAEPCPGSGIEASVVTRAQAKATSPPSQFVVHVTTRPNERKIVDGTRYRGDDDLPMHYAVTRASGIAVSGPAATDVFFMPTRWWILAYLADELDESQTNSTAYSVLNACRAWCYAERGELVSKVEGASWALDRLEDGAIVNDALAEHHGGRPPT